MENMDPIDSKGQAGADRAIRPPDNLTPADVRAAGLMTTSDEEGFKQLAFHLAYLGLCAWIVSWSFSNGYWLLFLAIQIPYGIGFSFVFTGFHEMVHNTAFKTQALNTRFAQVLGFFLFRGAKWFWCFHWQHHRFTNDPAKDPELSGGSADLDDPTRSLSAYLLFASGYPFGFERALKMFSMARGVVEDPWVVDKPEATRRAVVLESKCYCAGYVLLAVLAALRPVAVGSPLVLYWLLPHCVGAGHLRLYQFAEHRACIIGPYTETNAWVCARTTYTWRLYKKLAWYMPYHVEHHAYPNVPFHKLEATHEMVKAAYAKSGTSAPPSGCDPDGKDGYAKLHVDAIKVMLGRIPLGLAKAGKVA